MSISVLLSDGRAMFRQSVKHILENERDITVVGQAANGRDTVREVIRTRPGVVVKGIFMPEMNGIGATETVCEERVNARAGLCIMPAALCI